VRKVTLELGPHEIADASAAVPVTNEAPLVTIVTSLLMAVKGRGPLKESEDSSRVTGELVIQIEWESESL
jgi:hypothetical protein